MSYASRVILHLPLSNEDLLDAFVEQCLRDNVALIAVVGEGAARIEDIIDELVVSDGSDDTRFGFGVRRLVERRAKSARPNSKVIVRNNAGSGSFASILACPVTGSLGSAGGRFCMLEASVAPMDSGLTAAR